MPPAHLAEPLTEAKLYADFQTESIGQMALADLITSCAYDRHIHACRLRYRRRRDLLLDRLESRPANPAPGYSLRGIAAGLHALISLPPTGPGEEELLARATDHDMAISALTSHWHGDTPRTQG